jgi:tRNA dimethylallyltransferase
MSGIPQKSALLIAGPTASGKSALALKLARERNGVIINADSMQVYRELRILSARPSQQEEAEAPHRLYGHVSGQDAYSTGHWLKDALREMDKCWLNAQLPIVVGGTGLYFMALLGGLAEVPPIPVAIREKWRSFEGDLHAELARRDPDYATTLNPSDRQRLIRGLEVIEATGKSLLSWQREARDHAPLRGKHVEKLFLDVPRDTLYARAELRFDAMMKAGALDEVRALPDLPAPQPMMKAIGVPELQDYIQGKRTQDVAVRDAKTATRNYIKRQLTWWRNSTQDWKAVKPEERV